MGVIGRFLGTAALLAVACPARAADAERFFPPAGSILDYHNVSTFKPNGGAPKVTAFDVRRTVLSNDGLTAKVANEQSNTTVDGEPSPQTQPLSSPDNFTVYRLYFTSEFSTVVPRAGGEPVHRVMSYDCDKAALQSFLPLGRVPSVSVDCTASTAIDGTAAPPKPVVLKISYEGRSTRTSPAGAFQVANIRVVFDEGTSHLDTLYFFETAKGISIGADSKLTAPTFSAEITSELVRIEKTAD